MRTLERSPDRTAALVAPAERRVNVTYWWAALGAVSCAILVYVMTAWIVSGDAVRTPTGADPVPAATKVWAVLWQVLGVSLLLGAITYFWRRTRREGRLPIEGLIFVAWTINVWMDPASNNYIRPQLLYNSYLVNFGSWAPHIPGWLSPNANLLPEPVIAYTGIYGSQVLLSLMGVVAMRKAKQRWPHMGKLGQLGICLAVIMVIDLVLECILIRSELYAYPGAIKSLSLFGGERYQFPLYETVVFGLILTASAGLIHFKDDKGRSFVERGIDETRMSRGKVTTLRILSVTGFTFAIYLWYALVWCWASVYGGPFPEGYKSYMMNGMCGPGTEYACTAPNVPIMLPDSGPLPEGSPSIGR